jgi:holo-[acyl-carrier protein] synthase
MPRIETGIDLIEISRFNEINPKIKQRFLQRVFTQAEIAISSNRDEYYAGLFAVKEAGSKALGTGIGDIRWQDLEILPDNHGKPRLVLHGKAADIARRNGWTSWSVSITHTGITAAAVVTALIAEQE